MRLTKLALQQLKAALDPTATTWLYIAPESQTLPFFTMVPVATRVGYGFSVVLDSVTIQVSAYASTGDAAMDMLADSETAVEGLSADGSNSDKLICVHRSDERGPLFDGKDKSWYGSIDFELKLQRNKS